MPASNFELINSVVKGTSLEYRNHVGKVTRSTIADFIHNTDSYRISWNEFIPSLLNNVCSVLIKDSAVNNPYERFIDATIYEYGDWVEEIGMYLPSARDFELGGGNPFMYAPPEVATQYHGMNRAEYYPMSISEMELKRALLGSEYQASNMVADLSAACGMGASAGTVAIFENLIQEAAASSDIYNYQVPDFLTNPTEDNAIKVLVAIRAQMNRAMLPAESTKYNAFHLARTPKDFVLFCTPEFAANISVTAAWRSMNLVESTALPEMIPVRGLPSGVQCLLATSWFLRGMKTYEGMTSQFSPTGLYTNFFYHIQGIYFWSKMEFAVKFSTSATTAPWDSIPDQDATVASLSGTSDAGAEVAWDTSNARYTITMLPGDTIDLVTKIGDSAEVVSAVSDEAEASSNDGTPEPVVVTDGQDQAAIFKIYASSATLDTNTFLRPGGNLHISSEEAASTTITVKVYQDGNSTALQTLLVTVG